jgi:cytochrome c oxidase cbb3-type subunit III
VDLRPVALALIFSACGEPNGAPPPAPAAVRYDQHVVAGTRAPVGDTLHNPFAGNAKAAGQGEKLFAAMNCDGCHGAGATGFAAPSLVDGRWRYGGADAALFHSVFYGRPRGMPAYGGIVGEASIWQMVAYLRAQPVPAGIPTQAWP